MVRRQRTWRTHCGQNHLQTPGIQLRLRGPEIRWVTRWARLVLLNLRPWSRFTEQLPVCQDEGKTHILGHSDLHLADIVEPVQRMTFRGPCLLRMREREA